MQDKVLTYITSGITPYRLQFFLELSKIIIVNAIIEVKTSKDREWEIPEASSPNLKITVMKHWVRSRDSAFCPEVIKHLKKTDGPIIIGGYSTPTGILSILWLKLHGKEFILNADGGIIYPESRIKYAIKRFLISSASKWLSTGKRTDEYFIHYGADKSRIFQYPFTSVSEHDVLSKPFSKLEKQALRQNLNMGEEFIILSVGQFIYRKGFDVLLKTSAIRNGRIGVYIIGGNVTDEYNEIVRQHSLNNVHFIGFMQKNQIADYYEAADMFVLPTREDIWGLVINEAMAKGLAVITTDNCVAGLEMIDNGKNGIIVPTDNVEKLSEAIDSIIFDFEKRNAMSKLALCTARKYTIEKMADAHLLVL